MTSTARILVTCGDFTAAQALTNRLVRLGHAVCGSRDIQAAGVEQAADLGPDLVLIDLDQDAGFVEAAGSIRSRFGIPVVYLVGEVDESLLERARKTAPFGYVVKPLDDRQLRLSIDAALSQGAAVRRERESHDKDRETILELQRRVDVMDAVVDSMAEGVVATDLDGRTLLVNRAVKKMLGADGTIENVDQLTEGRRFFKNDGRTPFPPAERPLRLAMEGTLSDDVEVVVRCRDGAASADVHLSVCGQPFSDAQGRSQGGIVVFRDITRQSRAETELNRTLTHARNQAELMENVFDSMSEAIAVLDADGRCVLLNRQGHRVIGIGPQTGQISRLFDRHQIRYSDRSICPPQERPAARLLRGESFDNLHCLLTMWDSLNTRRVSFNGRPLLNGDGTARGGVVVFRDVTEEWRTETELQEATETLHSQKQAMETVINSISDGVVAADESGRFTIFNPSAERIVGVGMIASSGPDDWPGAYGLFLSDRTTPFPPDQFPLARALRGESSDGIELFVRNAYKPDGACLSVSGRPLRDANEKMVGGVVVFHDVTQLKDTEERLQRANDDLRQQNRFMELVFEGISDGVVVADAKGRLTMANASAKRTVGMGLTDAPSDDWSDLYGTFYPDRTTPFPSEQLPLVRALHGESSNDVELFIRNPHVPDGVHISVSGRPLQERDGEHSGGVIVFRDITQWLRAQEALLRAFDRGRLEVIETVLHNIGNAISSVATGVDTIRDRSRKDELVCRFVALAEAVAAHEEDWIHWLSHDRKGRNVRSFLLALVQDLVTSNQSLNRTAERASSRVRHIVDIIRTQESFTDGTVERKVVRLKAVITEAVKVLDGSLAARGIKVDVDCTSAPDMILVQENCFNQMLVNLLKNAMEAIDALVGLQPAVEHADRCIRVFACVREECLVIDVIDSGIGIAPEHTRDIFRAGYTTKPGGTGLGLHSAANFVTGSGGRIEVLSEGVGRGGATLKVTLPLVPFRQQSLPYQRSGP